MKIYFQKLEQNFKETDVSRVIYTKVFLKNGQRYKAFTSLLIYTFNNLCV